MEHFPQNEWRIDLSKRIAEATKNYPGIQAIGIGGSVARGVADDYSDLELSVYWNEVPSKTDRLKWLNFLDLTPVEILEIPEKGVVLLDDAHTYNGFQIDIWHASIRTAEQILKDVLEQFDSTPSKAAFLANARYSIALINEPLLLSWRERAKEYPRALAEKIIKDNVKYLGYHNFDTSLARHEIGLLMGLLSGLQKRVFNIVLALNSEYFSSYKRIDLAVSKFEILPKVWKEKNPNFIFELSLNQAVNEMTKIMRDTLLLVEKHFPEVNTKKIQEDLENPLRKPFIMPPKGRFS